MKKLMALFCVVALLLVATVPALANPSVKEPAVVIVDDGKTEIDDDTLDEETAELVEEDGLEVVVTEVNTENYDPEVAEVVEAVNSAAEYKSVREVVEALEDKLPDGSTLDDGMLTAIVVDTEGNETKITLDLDKVSFVTGFSEVSLSNDEITLYSNSDDSNIAVTTTLKIDALETELRDKEALAEYLSNYMIMVINPDTGEIFFIELNPDNYDAENNTLIVDFPCLGAFALVEKI